MKLALHFSPFDTWFFRESRPHGSVGSNELGSVFPPPARTLLGALRTSIGDAWHTRHGTSWRDFRELKELRAIIGYADDLGALRCRGPWLTRNDQRLYPAPANLMAKDGVYFSLQLGEPVHCDLGTVRLPVFPPHVSGLDSLAGAKPVEKCWLTEQGWSAMLQGKLPAADQVVPAAVLFHEEPRLGIGRDLQRQSVEQGLLYQTRHLRLDDTVGVELEVEGLSEDVLSTLGLPEIQVLRLGGEGRQASMSMVRQASAQILPTAGLDQVRSGLLYTLSPTPCAEGLPAGIPAGFAPVQHDGVTVWEGAIAGVGLRILSVSCGRVLREGGWDMVRHQARPVQSLLPAGSVMFVEVLDNKHAGLSALHNQHCGDDTALGRGHLVVGRPVN